MKRARIALLAAAAIVTGAGCVPIGGGGNPPPLHTFYVSPTGNDTTGTGTIDQPWQHFARAFSAMQAGDLLTLRDGTYNDSLAPPASLNGTATKPVMVWAEHDGLARINGQATRVPIDIEGNDYFDVRGIVAYNSVAGVVTVIGTSSNPAYGNTFRRVSAYNSAAPATDSNHHTWEMWHADNTLVEDCAVAGRGRTIMTTMESDHATFRRCWFRADARTAWQDGSIQPVVQIYNSSNALFENNVIAPGAIATVVGVVDWNNVYGGPGTEENQNNRYIGNVVTNGGGYGMSIGVTQCKLSRNHLWQDNVVVGSEEGYALRGGKNLVLSHDTAIGTGGAYGVWMNISVPGLDNDMCSPNNGNNDGAWGYFRDAPGATPTQHAGFDFTAEVKNSAIEGYPYGALAEVHDHTTPTLNSHDNNVRGTSAAFGGLAHAGANDTSAPLTWDTATYGTGAYLRGPAGSTNGARVLYRTVDGVLTNQPLWPWPMESRIWNETGDASMWQNANAMFPPAHQQSVTNASGGGLWKTLTGVY